MNAWVKVFMIECLNFHLKAFVGLFVDLNFFYIWTYIKGTKEKKKEKEKRYLILKNLFLLADL